ncbi:hypothetical protein F4810DRAFT_708999 [Camillea tinctor]|nr:hypothetical protein F4810DRAFT_708999 [Camillea tinctor]
MYSLSILLTFLLSLASVQAGLLKTPRTARPSPPSSSSTPLLNSTIPALTIATATAIVPTNVKAVATAPAAGPTEVAAAADSNDSSPPTTTPAPKQDTDGDDDDLGGIFHEIYGQKYTQTTYYSCVTFPLETHCGWHEPILEVQDSGAAAAVPKADNMKVMVAAGVVMAAGGLALGV